MLMPTFDKRPNRKKKPNNIKKMGRENSKANPASRNGKNNGQQAHKNTKR